MSGRIRANAYLHQIYASTRYKMYIYSDLGDSHLAEDKDDERNSVRLRPAPEPHKQTC